jgi:adenylylsulfate kinase
VRAGATIYFTGLPASGKSTLAERTRELFSELGIPSVILDSDEVRDALVPSPGYAPADRDGVYATLARLAGLLSRQGLVVLVAATAHLRRYREDARAHSERFFEVHLNVSRGMCEARDPKGLYARARNDPMTTLPGVGADYEAPERPDVVAEGGADERAARAIADLVTRS